MMISEKEKNTLIEKEARRMLSELTWQEVMDTLQSATAAEKAQILDIIKKTDSKLIKAKTRALILPKATAKINQYIQADSFPADFVTKLLKGGR